MPICSARKRGNYDAQNEAPTGAQSSNGENYDGGFLLPPVVISGLAYYAIGKWLLAAIKSGLAVMILLTVAKVYAAICGCAALILVICVVSGLALDPLTRVWRELEDRRDRRDHR